MRKTLVSTRNPWTVNPYRWREAQRLADTLGLPPIVATVLAGRGLADPEDARRFLDCSDPLPDPFLFGHMEGAVSTIAAAVERRRKIVVHGDYDADGVTATALMVSGLRGLGADPEWYLPNRFNEGFGLSRRAVDAIAAGGAEVLVTVDCGVNYPEEVALAREHGLDVVVVDHHRPGPVLPDCHVVHHVVGDYPHGDLCGVGLALKVMHALHMRLQGSARDTLPEQLYRCLDLVALGTIADLAALHGENRYYVREGLKLIAIGQRPGIRALASVSGCTGVADSSSVAYRLAPRLNAAGRLADPSPPLRLLLTEDEREAASLANKLHELNGARQEVERRIMEEALEQVEGLDELPPAVVLAGAEWHEGVVGIVASRLVERYHRPTILLGLREGVAKGSGRSVPAYDLIAGLNSVADLLVIFGGHAQAVGVTLEAERVEDFRRAMEEHAGRTVDARDLEPTFRADAVLRGLDVNADTASGLASLGPFGSGNPRPRLLLVGASVENPEATRNGAHLRCAVQIDSVKVRGIGFGMGDRAGDLRDNPGPRLIGVEFRVDEWQGVPRPEFLIERVGEPEDDLLGAWEHIAGECEDPPLADGEWEVAGDGVAIAGQSSLVMPPARDLRDQQGLATAVAQVLTTGERILILAGSVLHALNETPARLPLRSLGGADVATLGRECAVSERAVVEAARIAVVDWDTAAANAWLGRERGHVVAVTPPYRAGHVGFLRCATAQGAVAHLCYGQEERAATARLLRYLVHPRFAMICVYRAMQHRCGSDDGVLEDARRLGWQEAKVVLAMKDLRRAKAILAELGIEQACQGEAKLEARRNSAYVAAEANYEECSRLCLIL